YQLSSLRLQQRCSSMLALIEAKRPSDLHYDVAGFIRPVVPPLVKENHSR
ncbi:hypothetical protein KIPB_014198, partial [Kipferlia bialata]